MVIDTILSGTPTIARALLEGELTPWQILVEHLVDGAGEAAPAAFVHGLMQVEPAAQRWLDVGRHVTDQNRLTERLSRTIVQRAWRSWWVAGVLAALPPDRADVLELRFQHLMAVADDDATAQTEQLVADLERTHHALLPEGLLLLARRADEDGELTRARQACQQAASIFRESESHDGIDRARRAEAAALLRLRRVQEALPILDDAMQRRGPLFGGSGAFRVRPSSDPEQALYDEAATIASWASPHTPEWLRALGGLVERGGIASLQERVDDGLVALASQSHDRAISDLEAVMRQARERQLHQTSAAAARWLLRQRGVDEELRVEAEVAAHRVEVEPQARVAGLWELFDAHRDAAWLAESTAGQGLVEALLEAMASVCDPRAVEVAESLHGHPVLEPQASSETSAEG
ncbi:MAG: hypothetical protein KTR31_29155 [Myxococcales bacterium]|nr:hypothetical protein [Myxococcales bacterium]